MRSAVFQANPAFECRSNISFTIGIDRLPGDLKAMTGHTESQTTESKNTFIVFEDRPSDSPFVEKIWRCHSERGGGFNSIAACHFEMAVTRLKGKVFITLRGPETKAKPSTVPVKVSGLASASNWALSCHDFCQEVSVTKRM